MNYYYDRDGKPITLEDWARLMEDKEYRTVARDDDRRELYVVSTVWVGLNHRWLAYGPILIFETAIHGPNGWEIVNRYTTVEQARAGHAAALRTVQAAARN